MPSANLLQVAQQAWELLYPDDQKGFRRTVSGHGPPCTKLVDTGNREGRRLLPPDAGNEAGSKAVLYLCRISESQLLCTSRGLLAPLMHFPMEKGTGEQMLAMVSKSKGIKPEEMQWTGLADFLQNKESVTKQEIQDFVDSNKLQIEEVDTADIVGPNRDWEHNYTLPGGENYREVAFALESPAPIGQNLPPDVVADLGYRPAFHRKSSGNTRHPLPCSTKRPHWP